MNKDFLKGIKFGIGFLIVILTIGLISAVGFHVADEVMPGTFTGNYNFTGNVSFKEGNVGIGTTNPRKNLDVNGEIVAVNRMTLSQDLTTISKTWHLDNSVGKFRIFEQPNINTPGTERFIIDNTGNVGIGTSSPSYKLHVTGDIYANGGWLRTSGNSGWYSESYGGGWYMSDTSWIRTYGSKNVWTDSGLLGTQGGITSGYGGVTPPSGGAIIAGNVGIGTTNPQAKLEVVGGAIKATGGLIIETRTTDPATPAVGQIWLRTDLS